LLLFFCYSTDDGDCISETYAIAIMKFFSAVLVFFFLIRIRFPRDSSITHYILKKYGKNTLDLYRKIERNSFRSKKVEKDLKFLEICKCYGTIPDFNKFRVYCPTFQTTRTYRSWCFDLLDWEISNRKRSLP